MSADPDRCDVVGCEDRWRWKQHPIRRCAAHPVNTGRKSPCEKYPHDGCGCPLDDGLLSGRGESRWLTCTACDRPWLAEEFDLHDCDAPGPVAGASANPGYPPADSADASDAKGN